MAISSIDAGKTLCEISDWTMSNLRLQKVLYIAHMFHLGVEDGAPLVDDWFEAWDYGPVAPNLYHHAKGFGADRVRNIFRSYRGAEEGSSERRLLESAIKATSKMADWKLVRIMHWEHGAWQEVYEPGVPGILIPNELILREYHARKQRGASHAAQ